MDGWSPGCQLLYGPLGTPLDESTILVLRRLHNEISLTLLYVS